MASHWPLTDPADVLIIGAGPAGCSAAIYSAQRGMRATPIEGDISPRYRPGESCIQAYFLF